jgi:hypothetical protein
MAYSLTGVGMIPLRDRKGKAIAWATVDLSDFSAVMRKRWYMRRTRSARCAYVVSKRTRRERAQGLPAVVHLHRLLVGLPDRDPREVDHRNGNGLDCRRSNMRVVTHAMNQQNRRSYGKTSKHRGVSYDPRRRKWLAHAKTGALQLQRRFDTEQEAVDAVRAWRAEHMPHATD